MASGDQTVGFEPVDQPGDPAPTQHDPVSQLVHPQPPTGRLGQLEQGGVLGQGHLVFSPQIVVKATADECVRRQEGPPRSQPRIAGGQGSWALTGLVRLGCLGHR